MKNMSLKTLCFTPWLWLHHYGMTEKEKEEKYGSNKLDEDIIMAYFLDGINNHKIIQIGSNATIGKGLIRVCTMKGES